VLDKVSINHPWIFHLVYVFIGENWALLDFIDIMNDRNLLSTGEYVVLAIDNSIDDVSDNQVKFHSNNTSSSGQSRQGCTEDGASWAAAWGEKLGGAPYFQNSKTLKPIGVKFHRINEKWAPLWLNLIKLKKEKKFCYAGPRQLVYLEGARGAIFMRGPKRKVVSVRPWVKRTLKK